MSLLNIASGIRAATGGGGPLGLGILKQNRSAEADCWGQVNELGLSPAAAVAKYPQCAPYLSGAPPGGGYPVPQVWSPPPPPLQQISYAGAATPAMTMLSPMLRALPTIPQLGAVAGRYTGQALAAVKRALPTLKRDLAIASGFTIASGLIYDQAGNLVGKTRRRRRINPLNYRAACRAARRLGMVQDLTSQILKALPYRAKPAKVIGRPFKKRRKC